jgi:two-component system sensor histidine kinase DegS
MNYQKKIKNAEINIELEINRLKVLMEELGSQQIDNEFENLNKQIKELVNLRKEEIIQSQESERRKLARELHDGPAQILASAIIRLELMGHLQPDQNTYKQEIESIKNICRESLAEIRQIMFDCRPALLRDKGLTDTLAAFFDDYKAKFNFNIDFELSGKEKKYGIAMDTALLRLIQEAITNVRKHAGVNKALVRLENGAKVLTLVIKDEGSGFDTDEVFWASKDSYGILGMKERVQLLGGEMEIISSQGIGTQVIIKVPVEGEDIGG